MSGSEQGNTALISIVVVVLLAAAGTAAVVTNSGNEQQQNEDTSVIESPSPSATPDNTVSSEGGSGQSGSDFNDGSYEARGSYLTPGGNESIDLKVTLEDGVIKDASITQNAISNEAKQYQGQFTSGFRSEVVGKKIENVSLTRVAGSSLTPIGFNNAVNDIENQARA